MRGFLFSFVLIVLQLGFGQNRQLPRIGFLEWQGSAMAVSLGNSVVSWYKPQTASSVHWNPGLSPDTSAFQYTHQFASPSAEQIAVQGVWKAPSNWNFGIIYQSIQFDRFFTRDETGVPIGEIEPAYFGIGLHASKAISNFRIGINSYYVNQKIQSYSQSGFVTTIGAHYTDTTKLVSFGIQAKQFGYLKNSENESYFLKPNIQMGVSTKLRYVPVTFHLSSWSLNESNLVYYDPAQESENNNAVGDQAESNEPTVFQEVFAHLVLGAELKAFKVLAFRMSFDYLSRQFQSIPSEIAGKGLAFGFGWNAKRFNIDYAWKPVQGLYSLHSLSVNLRILPIVQPIRKRFMS